MLEPSNFPVKLMEIKSQHNLIHKELIKFFIEF